MSGVLEGGAIVSYYFSFTKQFNIQTQMFAAVPDEIGHVNSEHKTPLSNIAWTLHLKRNQSGKFGLKEI